MAEPILRNGSSGEAVRELQVALQETGHNPGSIDGVFGAQTEAAVKAFQEDRGGAGSYVNNVSVTVPGITDPNTANNTASATLSATLSVTPASVSRRCAVPKLKNTPSAVAKTVLNDLGCAVRVTRQHSKSVHRGNVIRTNPGRGTYAFDTRVRLAVSSGPKKRHKKHAKHAIRHAAARAWLF